MAIVPQLHWFHLATQGRFESALRATDDTNHDSLRIVSAQRWLATGVGRSAEIKDISTIRDGTLRALFCAIGSRVALLQMNRAGLDDWAHAASATEVRTESGIAAVKTCHGWAHLAREEFDDAQELALSLRDLGGSLGRADLLSEGIVLRALIAAGKGEMQEGVKLARRASRMTRSDGLPQQEYLAGWTLARLRRLVGRPHLATLILRALQRYAPPSWSALVAWERSLASRPEPGSQKTNLVSALLFAAEAADRPAFEAAAERLLRDVAGFGPALRDAQMLLALLDPTKEAASAQPFRDGRAMLVPRGLHGVVSIEEHPCIAYVLAHPAAPSARILGSGAKLGIVDYGAHRLETSKQIRTDSALALLSSFRGEPLGQDDFFRILYGFAYQPHKHRTVRNMLYTRLRARLDGLGSLHLDNDQIGLALNRSLLVPDPRSASDTDHALLRLLAQSGRVSASEAARVMGIPTRTAQHLLKELAESGACDSQKRGRAVEYRLEDTTFSEPTNVGSS